MSTHSLVVVVVVVAVAVGLLYMRPKNDLSIYDSADWWNESSSFSILKRMNDVRVPFFLSRLPAGGFVLDAGCGGGLVTEAIGLSGKFSEVLGMDLSNPSLDKARSHLNLQITKLQNEVGNVPTTVIRYQQGSLYRIDLADNSVDGVIVSDVFEHLDDVPRALTEIHRVLRPGGVLVFDTIARTWWSWMSTYFVAQEVLGLVERGVHDWSLFINPTELKNMLAETGFELKRTNSVDWVGIGASLSLWNAIQKRSLYQVIEYFYEDPLDLSASYMGAAYKPL